MSEQKVNNDDMLKSIHDILQRGNNAEVRKNNDGKIVVLEVIKKKKCVIE